MIGVYGQVLHTYTSRRWPLVVFGIGALVLLAILMFAADASPDAVGNSLVSAQFVAFPVLLASLLIAQQGKCQFAHPRSRLVPRFAAPHLTVLAVLLSTLVVLFPIFAGWRLGLSYVGLMAFSSLMVAMVVWQIQSLRNIFTLGFMTLYFSLFYPAVAEFWIANNSAYFVPRLALLCVGLVGIAAWLVRLTQFTEQDDDYLVPVQAGYGFGSRGEQTEARQLLARWTSRQPLHRWVCDRWHARLADMPAPTEAVRPRLLRYGMSALPLPFVAMQFLVLMAIIVGMQFVYLSSVNSVGEAGRISSSLLAQFGLLCLMVPAASCQMLAARLPRLGQELLLPMSREALVASLQKQLVYVSLWTALPTAVIVAVVLMLVAPELLTTTRVTAAIAIALAVQPAMFALAHRLALIRSGLKRLLSMFGLVYVLAGAVFGMYAMFVYGGIAWGLLLAGLLFGLGAYAMRRSRAVWLEAELG